MKLFRFLSLYTACVLSTFFGSVGVQAVFNGINNVDWLRALYVSMFVLAMFIFVDAAGYVFHKLRTKHDSA